LARSSLSQAHKVWWNKGYTGAGNVEVLLDSLTGPAIVAGNARGVFEDVEKACAELGDLAVVYAANDVGVYLPRVDHLVSLHGPKLAHWVALRRDDTSRPNGNNDFKVHDAGFHGKADWYQWKDLTPVMSLSGYFAAQIAYLMGCSPIVLCGCPGDATPRFWERTCTNPGYVQSQQSIREEMGYKPEFKKAVRSMSGWSREFFGGL
jgi:hypothetical protein